MLLLLMLLFSCSSASILLYSKVGEPAAMQETARVWLRCPGNRSLSGFRTVAELYLLHVLVPLGSRAEAEELILGEIGSSVFTEDQRQTALELLEDKGQPHGSSQNSQPPAEASAPGLPGNVFIGLDAKKKSACLMVPCSAGTVLCRLEAVLKFFSRKLLWTRSGPFSLQRLFLAAVLLYMLLLRLDPGGF